MKKLSLFISICATGILVEAQTNNWVSNGPYGGHIISLAIHPSNPNTVYAGCDDSGGIYKTTDGGDNWNMITSSVPDV